ncbi:MAG TPA: hypothetical protein PKD53_07760 [Chloroflexaceae bacterium]|nr:hypothetical protein [Chloroflexaceae bacterium]
MVAATAAALAGRQASATLSQALKPGDLLALILIGQGGEGRSFLYTHRGSPVAGNVTPAQVQAATWQEQIAALDTADASVRPLSHAMSASGEHIAVGLVRVTHNRSDTTGLVRVLDQAGELLWEQSYDGRVFFVRFAPDGRSLYVAANLGDDGLGPSSELYTNAHIIKYTLAGGEQWRHKVGSGTGLPAERQGRTVFDLQVAPNGDLFYAEWNALGVRLDGATGRVIWSADTAGGTPTYAQRVVPLADGGAVLLGFYSRCVDAAGQPRSSVLMNREGVYAASAVNCDRWALAGNTVRVIDRRAGALRIDNPGAASYAGDGTYVGRYPRALAFSPDGDYLATGTTDGQFTLMNRDGRVLWQRKDASSYITQVAFLPDGDGIALAREVFDYQHDNPVLGHGWRYRDSVEAYDLQGRPLWRHEGPWRDAGPFMTQFALSGDGKQLSVLSGAELRLVDLARAPVPNSYLYPVEAIPARVVFLPLIGR